MPAGYYERTEKHKQLLRDILDKYRKAKRPSICGDNNVSKRLEVKEKIRLAKLGKPRKDMVGDKNPAKRIDVRKKISAALKGRAISWGSKISNTIRTLGTSKGANNGRWQGGIAHFPYSIKFVYKLKEQIRKRDCYTCQYCGKTQEENKIKLHIHHIDYNKLNSRYNNLISLCNICHSKSNGNRDYWYAYFTYIQKEGSKNENRLEMGNGRL